MKFQASLTDARYPRPLGPFDPAMRTNKNDSFSRMLEDDIDRAARQMIERHGRGAEDKARRYAEMLMTAGDDDAWAIWRKVADTIQKLWPSASS
jgi:hypothetical protein